MEVEFKMPKGPNSMIMVAGIGGGGGNAVKHMYSLGVNEVNFMVINTDRQALDRSPIDIKIQLGDGLGAGNNPEKAREAAELSEDKIREQLLINETRMLFVTAGMGGGTGTGASPVVARIAKDMGILTVGVVSIPYRGEGPKRVKQAVAGIEELLPCVDSLIVINNEHIAQIHGKLGIKEAHAKADDILTMASKSIADIVTSHMDINVDFADVTTVMREDTLSSVGKVALMGTATGSADGEGRALAIAEEAVNSPLLHHNDLRGARKVLLSITWGSVEVSYEEAVAVMDFIQQRSGLINDPNSNQTDVIWGAGEDPTLGNNIRITVVATGYDTKHIPAIKEYFTGIFKPEQTTRQNVVAAPKRQVIAIDEPLDGATTRRIEKPRDDEFSVVTHQSENSSQSTESISTPKLTPTRIEVPNLAVKETKRAEVVEHIRVGSGSMPVVETSSINSLVMEDQEDQLSKPAYLRRGVSLYSEARNNSSTRESLDGNRDNHLDSESTNSLFE